MIWGFQLTCKRNTSRHTVFGNKEGPTFFEGLVDCSSEQDFDSKLSMLEERWDGFECLRDRVTNDGIDFFSWFNKYHAEDVKSAMLRPI